MSSSGENRVLISTRLLALVIIPFLLGAFIILYVFPGETARLFAWPIKPTMTSMVLAGQDYNYEPGQEPMVTAVKRAAAKLS